MGFSLGGLFNNHWSNPFDKPDSDSGGWWGRAQGLARSGGLSAGTDLYHDAKNKWGLGGGGDPNTYASDTFAALTRERWNDYITNIVPIENQLIDYATNKETVSKAMTSASEDVNDSFDAQEGVLGRRLRGLGVTLNEDEQAASAKSSNLSRALADAGAQNNARDLTMSRQQQILGNPAPDIVRAGSAAGLGG